MAAGYRRNRQSVNFWPGYVDGLSGLLMMMLFLLLFYVLGELIYTTALDSSEKDSEQKSTVISDLLSQLTVFETKNVSLEQQIQSQRQDIQDLLDIQDTNRTEISDLLSNNQTLTTELSSLNTAYDEQKEQLGLLTARLDSERASLAETLASLQLTTTTLKEREKSLQESENNLLNRTEELALTNQELANILAERDQLKLTLAAAKQSLGETLAVQADRILVLEQSLENADAASKKQLEEIQALSDEQVLLVGRIADFEELERERLNTLAALNADIMALQNLREELQDQLGVQAAKMAEKDQSLLQSLAEMKLLNRQILTLNDQLKQVNTILAVREEKIAEQNLSLENLGQRLNMALASEIQRLQRYRSDFFERMGEVLANSPQVKVVDDRFILQSEVLFPSSSAELSNGGKRQLQDIAQMLSKVIAEAPTDLPWILRVDGHTDNRPINTTQFPSNWALSTARAIAVVEHLIELGIPETRLAATGFAHLHPIEDRDDEIAYRRNRRIEMKLTQR